jgi:serine/threonine-protein kinase
MQHDPATRSGRMAAPDARIGKVLDSRYRLVERLAAGGMGVVYRAERVGLARQVAVKFLHRSSASVPGHRARFEREAAAMSRVTHPNLVSIIDFGSTDGVPYLVMDYHPGVSLRRALKAGAMEGRRAVFIARQILAGIGSAHASGVVHRDLKPGNVLLVGSPGEDLVKILDFGVAKLLEGDGGPSDLSAVAGYVLGTPEYMSPEQARVERIDQRSDIYAVGVLLYEMVTGRLPFQAEGDLAILHKHIEETPRAPRAFCPEISPELEAATMCALEKARERRWQSAAEFSKALAAVPEGGAALQAADLPAGGPPAPAPTEASRPEPVSAPEFVSRPRFDTPGMATVAARPAAMGRVVVRRTASRRREPRIFLLVCLIVGGVAAGGLLFAASQGLIDWTSWLPWR